MSGVHEVHCFGCGSSYQQSGPHPRVCGSCGSARIGVCSEPTDAVWSVALVGSEGPQEVHVIQRSGVGDLVQAVVEAGVGRHQAVVVTPPGADVELIESAHEALEQRDERVTAACATSG